MEHSTVDQHAATVRTLVDLQLGSESVPLDDALGRVTVADVTSPVDLPLFRNSQMDGFAVRAADTATTTALPIAGEIAARAGSPAALEPGTAVRIMTGGIVPEGADAVVPVEDTIVAGDAVSIQHPRSAGETVQILRPRQAGEYVRDRGSDLRAGGVLVAAGTVLAARHLAAIAAAGLATITVRRLARVAVITTGAELIAPGAQPRPGQVFDANQVALVALVRSTGAVVTTAQRVPDDVEALRTALTDSAAVSDLIITSGGISKGEYEVVRELLAPLGGAVEHLAMQPGGPQFTATFNGAPVVSFPGNPVSTQVSFVVFLRDLLLDAAGLPHPPRSRLPLAQAVDSVAGKRQFLRARVVNGRVELVSGPGSHLVVGMAAADLLVDVPADTTRLEEGDTVETWLL
ncbi:MAG: gephyrin-like molybdotransferase Glp [Rhodoglobus sp.]